MLCCVILITLVLQVITYVIKLMGLGLNLGVNLLSTVCQNIVADETR